MIEILAIYYEIGSNYYFSHLQKCGPQGDDAVSAEVDQEAEREDSAERFKDFDPEAQRPTNFSIHRNSVINSQIHTINYPINAIKINAIN